ncbi:YraN family protein [Aquirufa nivalisilvae]
MAKHLMLGKQAERVAEEYLRRNHYQILDKNYRTGKAEVDIIAQIHQTLVFIEVKSLRRTRFGFPEEQINNHKINMLSEAANQYQIDRKWDKEIRFDSISITFLPQATKLEHFEDAFL